MFEEMSFEMIIGKKILIGLTYINDDESIKSMVEIYGNIIKASESDGIVVSVDNTEKALAIAPYLPFEDGNIFILPPDLESIKITKKRKGFHTKSTDEDVENVDYLTMWVMKIPDEA